MATGHIEWRNGRPSFVIDWGYDGKGGRARKRFSPEKLGIPVPKTEKEANAALRRVLTRIDEGIFVQPTEMRVREYLEWWLKTTAVTRKWKPNTAYAYRQALELYVLPALGDMKLRKVTALHVQELYARLLEDGALQREGGLSVGTVRQTHAILHAAFKRARKLHLLPTDPTEDAELPRAERYQPVVLDAEGAARLLDLARRTPIAEVVELALLTGLRRGELLGLKWDDVDLEAGVIHVRGNLTGRDEIALGTPKTSQGLRDVPLGRSARAVLQGVRRRQAEERLRHGPGYSAEGWVFAGPGGEHLSPAAVSQRFRRLARAAGLGGFRFHDLRHACATALKASRIPDPEIERWMGWASPDMIPTYTHPLPGQDREAAAALDRAFGHQMGTKEAPSGPSGKR